MGCADHGVTSPHRGLPAFEGDGHGCGGGGAAGRRPPSPGHRQRGARGGALAERARHRAFVLKYRLARADGSTYKMEVHEMDDTRRALRLVRSRARQWNLYPARVGMMGFSAGEAVARAGPRSTPASATRATRSSARAPARLPDRHVPGRTQGRHDRPQGMRRRPSCAPRDDDKGPSKGAADAVPEAEGRRHHRRAAPLFEGGPRLGREGPPPAHHHLARAGPRVAGRRGIPLAARPVAARP